MGKAKAVPLTRDQKRFSGLPVNVVEPNPRKIRLAIIIEVEAQEEDIDPEGNCSAIDDETDANQERWIRHQLESGNPWAWAHVVVTASMGIPGPSGVMAQGSDSLGGCSYYSGLDFCQPDGYFPDMVKEAIGRMLADWKAKDLGRYQFFREPSGDYCGIYGETRDDPTAEGGKVYDGRGTAIKGDIGSVQSTSISTAFLEQCKWVHESLVPKIWRRAIAGDE